MNEPFKGNDAELLAVDEFPELAAIMKEVRQGMIKEIRQGSMFFHPMANVDNVGTRPRQLLAWALEYTLGAPQKVILAFKDLKGHILSNGKWYHYWMLLPIALMSLLKFVEVAFRAFRTCVISRDNVLTSKRQVLEDLEDGFL